MFHSENAIFKNFSALFFGKRLLIAIIFIFSTQLHLSASCIYYQILNAEPVEVGNLLYWSTQTETESAAFLIQRSLDGVEFATIGKIDGAGNSDTEQSYRFLDVETGALRVLYRLIQVDKSGLGTPSLTVVANRITPNRFLITDMEQTKVDRWFRCTLQSDIVAEGIFSIRDKYDDIVDSGELFIKKGQNQLAINLENLKPDTYLIVFEAAEEAEQIYIIRTNNIVMNND